MIELSIEPIAEFYQRWQVTEFALFGSVRRDASVWDGVRSAIRL